MPPTTTIPKKIPPPAAVTADKSLLKQQAYDQLKGLIQSATFEPGAFLSERQLAAHLGMSKTPIKAALERLEAEGFVAVSPQQGIVVRDLSIHEIADQFEIRLALESFVLRNIAGRLSDENAALLKDNLRQQQQAAKQSNVTTSARLDSAFHTLFCEFLGNQEILRVMLQLREKMHRVVTRVFQQNSDRLAPSYREHKAIADAVLAGDADQATVALEEHLNYGKQLLLSRRR
ncbi:MAG: GntR family transcriptional regulator [Planctomycetes bacterium]|nr:GntR family transcriptional regulator [Planctomycetota bacterium]